MAEPDVVKYRLLAIAFTALLCGPAAGADAVKIGVLTDESGPYALFSGPDTVIAANLAVEQFGGTVLGRPIEILSADHRNDVARASKIALDWFDHQDVAMITDLTGTPVALAVQKIARGEGRIDIVTGAASPLLTGLDCSRTGFHWVYDDYALGRSSAAAVMDQGDKTWFFITTEAPFGAPLETSATGFITAAGGQVVGHVSHPPGITDFSPYLLKAQQSGAQIVAVADAGDDADNLVRQAAEFGIGRGGQRVAGLLMSLSDVQSLGLELVQGMVLTVASYWDLDAESRAVSQKFFERTSRMPNMDQAGVYSAVLHYLKAVQAAGTTDGTKVAEKMREIPVDDAFTHHGVVRPDGLMQHDMYLAVVKSPDQSKRAWDDLEILQTIPGEAAFLPLAENPCPLLAK